MNAIRCNVCNLLVAQNGYLGNLLIAIPGNHEPVERDGFATVTEEPVCPGSELLGWVEEKD